MEKERFLNVLKREIERTTGCTDPVAVSLAVARATRALGSRPDKIDVLVSPNVYKNGVSVGIPGTGRRGLPLAAALGAVIDRWESGLGILDFVDGSAMTAAQSLLNSGNVQVHYDNTPDPLYIRATVSAGPDQATATIAYDYANLIQVTRNGDQVWATEIRPAQESEGMLRTAPVRQLVDLIQTLSLEDLAFLVEAAETNRHAALAGIGSGRMRLGPALARRERPSTTPLAVASRAQTLTAAAGEARMLGMKVPIMAITGSGNHGITNFLGVLAVAEELGSPPGQLARALAISSMITVYIKEYIQRMTAFCGCSVAAATGVAAAAVYLLDGAYPDMVHAMQSVIGTLSGMLCDGAKDSCAFKISTATSTAIQFAYLAMDGVYIPAGSGILGNTIEETFANLGELNNPGMVETDRFILHTIERTQG